MTKLSLKNQECLRNVWSANEGADERLQREGEDKEMTALAEMINNGEDLTRRLLRVRKTQL